MLYADSSVLLSLYIPENRSAKAEKLLSSHGSVSICSLSEVEFNSAISRLVRMKELSRDEGHRVIAHFHHHLKDHVYTPLPLAYREYELARDWIGSLDNSLRTLDALHLAVAYSNQLTIVTADNVLAKNAKLFGVKYKKL